MMRKRRNILKNMLNGRPGLVCPMDAMTQSSSLSYACSFGVTIFLIYQIILEQKFAIPYDGPVGLKMLIAVVSMLIYGMVFFPIFACLAIGSVFGYGISALYVWAITAVNIYKTFSCDVSVKTRIAVVLRALPLLGSLLYLSISIPGRFIKAVRKRQFFVVAESVLDNKQDLETIRKSPAGLHVIKLLEKPEPKSKPSPGICGKIKHIIRIFLKKTLYHWDKDFRYPSRFSSIMIVGIFLLYVLSFEFMTYVFRIFVLLDTLYETEIEKLGLDLGAGGSIYADSMHAIKISMFLSLSLACAIGLLMIVYMLSSYRANLKALFRGDHSVIPGIDARSNAAHMVGFIRYAGYQVGYIVWGFIIQSVIFLILTLAISTVSILSRYGMRDWFVKKISDLWPALLLTILLNIFQILLSKFFFLQDKGQRLRLDNRRLLYTFTYFMFFFNVFLGLVSCLLRILKSIVVGALFMSRLDISVLPQRFQFFDPGFAAYVGYLHVENAHTHPVMFVFIRLMKMNLNSEYRHSTTVDMEMKEIHNGVVSLGLNELANGNASKEKESQTTEQWRRRYAACFKWWLAYTLINNPELRFYRKGYMQVLKLARQEGVAIPVSDDLTIDIDAIKRKLNITESTHL
ncbi:receptor for retinol uptake stra6-like [Gigantopelta aegis]|uniref:receptor for retinol uptake stra6-like n=1 Tax=Gigantopelta aegis TaxID=1735272 RepID=UPI001B8878FB|nr:receptor for retinol uptake stra6-like [Gigantopelta aegis]